MTLNWLDISVFLMFIFIVVGISLYKSRREKTSEDYFLASRWLPWWLIGFSLIAANISTEQFVGMNGSAAGAVGLAIASYDWIAAITLVFVAIYFLPKFLRIGIFTLPEYLEHRYNPLARGIMAFYTIIIYVAVTIAAVLYSGGLTLHTIFDIDLTMAVWAIGFIAALYTTWGGLKAVAWADLFQGSALIIGGLCVAIFGFVAVGGVSSFMQHNSDKLHVFLPGDHPELPWTALLIGLWIPNLYYWGLNQYIAQRTLAARNLKHGQLGIIMAGGIQVFLPLIIVIPGIMAHQLYAGQMSTSDAAFPLLIRHLIPAGLRGFIFAAIAGAVISSLASMLNSASTILTMDLYKRHLNKDASSFVLISFGRIATIVFVVIGCVIAPQLGDPRFRGIFHYIQDFQGYISPGILAAFLFGMIFKRAPSSAGVAALILGVPVYGILHLPRFAHIAFLNKMAISFSIIVLAMSVITWMRPLDEPKIMAARTPTEVKTSPIVYLFGAIVVIATLSCYVIFR